MAAVLAILASLGGTAAAFQLDAAVRDQVVPAVVQVAFVVQTTDESGFSTLYQPTGSGTLVSPEGLILTNAHVIDLGEFRSQLDRWGAEAGGNVTFALDEDHVLILAPDPDGQPEPAFLAEVAAEDPALDLAVLRVVSDEHGWPVEPDSLDLPFVPLGDSDALRIGDRIDVFGYPGVGGDSLTYSAGAVSGFIGEEGVGRKAWIKTDAVISGGSSGGTAVNARGELVGVPTQGAFLDCRPVDANGDGSIDADDAGCRATGGAIGQLRAADLAVPLLERVGFTQLEVPEPNGPTSIPSPSPTNRDDLPESLQLETLLPTSDDVPPRMVLKEDGSQAEDEVAATFPDPREADDLLAEWGWRANAYRTFAEPDWSATIQVSVHRFADASGAAAALPFFADGRAESSGLRHVDLGPVGEQSEAVAGRSGADHETTIYVRVGADVVRVSAFSPDEDRSDDALAVARVLVDRSEGSEPIGGVGRTEGELLALIAAAEAPPGLMLAGEGERTLEDVGEAFADPAETVRLFREWGWQANAFRDFSPARGGSPSPSGLDYARVGIHQFGGATQAAAAARHIALDILMEAGGGGGDGPPMGDGSILLTGRNANGTWTQLIVHQGPFVVSVSGSSPEGDPTAAVIDVTAGVLAEHGRAAR